MNSQYKPRKGWKYLGAAVYEHIDSGTRLHVSGLIRLASGEYISLNNWPLSHHAYNMIGINGGNRKRVLMAMTRKILDLNQGTMQFSMLDSGIRNGGFMSNECREVFEKWFKEEREARRGTGNEIISYFDMWKAGRADLERENELLRANSAKIHVETKMGFQSKDTQISDLERENAELKAHVKKLKSVLGYALKDSRPVADEWAISDDCYDCLTAAFNQTPAQALAAHDKEVRERCAKVCDARSENSAREGLWAQEIEAGECADDIRAM